MRFHHHLFREQNGVYHESQAAQLGLSRLDSGGYPGVRVLPAVWSLLPPPLPEEAHITAALLHAGPSARLTGTTAASLLGWLWLPPDQVVRVAVDNGCKVASRDFVSITAHGVAA